MFVLPKNFPPQSLPEKQLFFAPAAMLPIARLKMTDDAPHDYPEAYLEAIRLFNDEEFFECHDVLEELWSEVIGDQRAFYQGLIQFAVALFHFGNENLGGARKMYESARRLMDPYAPEFMGIRVDTFLADMRHCFEELLVATDQYPAGVVLRDERVPKIHLAEVE